MKITLELDEDDARDVNAAIATWQARARDSAGVNLPEGESCIRGAILAIICRGWLDSLEESE